MKKKIIKYLILLSILIVMAITVWVNITYSPDIKAINFTVDTENVDVVVEDFGISFIPLEVKKTTGIIFYPGAKVESIAYSPLAYELAEKGYMTIIVKMPFNLAVIDVDRGKEVIDYYENIKTWYIGGHSLGGAMAGNFAYDYNDLIEGVFFLGAYPVENLSDSELKVLLINGSLDSIIDQEKLKESKKLIPKTGKNITIQGGNHSQFGSYGLQKNDQKAEISFKEQQEQTIEHIIDLIKREH